MKILLVDDNEAFIDGLAELLAADGHIVRVCHSGVESLTAAPRFAPDLVFLDMGLPDMGGYEVAKRLRTDPALASARFVSISGCGDELDQRPNGETFFSHSLVKPLRIEELEKLLAKLETD
ncbi:MAG: response regulator [Spirochaetales bacterium]|nr:response regulator [Spirochaetales bacterium]